MYDRNILFYVLLIISWIKIDPIQINEKYKLKQVIISISA